jgi:hypothetical protein
MAPHPCVVPIMLIANLSSSSCFSPVVRTGPDTETKKAKSRSIAHDTYTVSGRCLLQQLLMKSSARQKSDGRRK